MVSTVDVDAYIDTAATNGSLVTTVIVTSYVRSHPKTDLLLQVVESLKCIPSLEIGPKIIVFDGYNVSMDPKVWKTKKGLLTVEQAEAIVVNNNNVSSYIWGTMPITWGLGLVLIGVAALMDNKKDNHSAQWVFAGPLVTGLGMIGAYLFEPLWLFFMVAMIISLPIGIMMLMGKLDYLYSEESS